MLNAEFACGHRRCNENIALSSIDQIFHSEHNRLVDDINNTLNNDTSPAGVAALAQWKAIGVSGYNYGERFFQAARFVTEMEYQHAVSRSSREGAAGRPAVPVSTTDINPAIKADSLSCLPLRHSIWVTRSAYQRRPGHGAVSDNSLPLWTPPESAGVLQRHGAGMLNARRAACRILMVLEPGRQRAGRVVDDTLRNNLLGLPLASPR